MTENTATEETTKIDTSMFVPRDYEMDPETEDLVHGEDLQQGMVVLIESSMIRENPDRAEDDYSGNYVLERLKKNNQWCTVTDLRHEGELVTFVGVYENGVKRVRTFNESYYWIVKL